MAKPPTLSLSLSLGSASIVSRIKDGYLLWIKIAVHIPKNNRYTLGQRIENKFLDILEAIYIAYFSEKSEKPPRVSACIIQLDALKFLISVAWEGKLISQNQYQEIALKLDEIGKMLGGWRNSLNNPDKKNRAS